MVSSGVIAALKEHGASPDAARKRLGRAVSVGSVRRLTGLRFPHNERFLYLGEQYGTEQFVDALLTAMRESGSVYGIALSSLAGRGGVRPSDQLPVISGSPTALTGHIPTSRVLEELTSVKFLERFHDPSLGEVLRFTRRIPMHVVSVAAMRARLVAEDVLLAAIANWLRKNSYVSYNMVRTRPPLGRGGSPEFGHFHWDLSAPSYLHPLAVRSRQGIKPGFVVVDVVLGSEIGEEAARYFLNKCALLRAQPRVRPALAMFVASGFSSSALHLGRSAGHVFTTSGNLFGDEVAAALENLISVLTNAAAAVASNPAGIDRLMSELSRIEGAASNLRGPMFEMIVGMLVKEEGGTIDMGERVSDPATGALAQIDVLRVKGREEIWAYECKGKEPAGLVSLTEVKAWLTRQVSRIDAWARGEQRFDCNRLSVSLWTSGKFAPDALAALERAQANTKRYGISWKDGEEVYAFAAKANHQYAKKLLNEHFRQHPLS
jgi:hypothetical protein